MKHIVLFFTLIFSFSIAHSLDLNVHGDVNDTNISYDFGIDVVSKADVYFTTGLYRDQLKEYDRFFDNEGLYFGFGKHFMIGEDLSIAADAKMYKGNDFKEPIYCLRITQILSFF